MSLSSLVEGEGRLLGVLGANLTLGGTRIWVQKAHATLESFMPCLNDVLVLVQIAVAVATLIYMALKIKKIYRKLDA